MLAEASQGEARLLARAQEILGWLSRIDERQAGLIREVVATIIGGQHLDLQRFAGANGDQPVSLPDAASLDDYTWRVAGCVGAFWTKLGFLTMSGRFSVADPEELLRKGIDYGKGLQLVNILRDLPRDLAAGRCYLPVADPADRDTLMACFGLWREHASVLVEEGLKYADALDSRRLRAASVLPALLADETLDRLRGVGWEDLQTRIKVPRSRVYVLMLRALIW
jgi:farnesyl-diphosphate farnesyltransferase